MVYHIERTIVDRHNRRIIYDRCALYANERAILSVTFCARLKRERREACRARRQHSRRRKVRHTLEIDYCIVKLVTNRDREGNFLHALLATRCHVGKLGSVVDVEIMRQNDENQILKLAVDGLITGPDGMPYGSAGFVINCPVIGFMAQEPIKDLVPNPLSR